MKIRICCDNGWYSAGFSDLFVIETFCLELILLHCYIYLLDSWRVGTIYKYIPKFEDQTATISTNHVICIYLYT